MLCSAFRVIVLPASWAILVIFDPAGTTISWTFGDIVDPATSTLRPELCASSAAMYEG